MPEIILKFGEIGILLNFFFMGTEIEDSRLAPKAYRPIIVQITKSLLSIIIAILTLLFSTAWITIVRAFIHKEKSHTRSMILSAINALDRVLFPESFG